MNYSINDELRNKIIDENNIENTLYKLDQLKEDEKNKIIHLFLSDYCKLRLFNYIDNKDFESLNNFINLIENVKMSGIYDDFLLKAIIDGSSIFNNLSYISKIHLFEILSKNELNNFLISISNTYFIDKINFQFNYDLESFKKYYVDFNTKDHLSKKESISSFIANKLIDYSKKNYDEYKSFICNFIEVYYKWNMFVCNNMDKNSLYNEDYIYLSLISLNDLDTIVKYSLNNIEFLKSIIDGYLFYSTSYKEISEPIVDEHYNNINNNIKNKFKSCK